MAIYRQLHTTFWKDDFIGDCSQIEKLFYLYLISNDKTTQSGAYEFSYRYAQFELGITKQQVDELINFFVSKGKIKFNKENNEVLLVNWLKYNSARSPKVAPVIDKELDNLRTIEFKSEVVMNCEKLGYPIKTKLKDIKPIDRVSKKEIYPIDTISQPSPSPSPSPESTHNQHHHQQENKTVSATVVDPYEFYQNNFGVLAPIISETIKYWVDDIGTELVVEAMSRALKEQKGFRYAEGIMRNWAKRNIVSMESVKADDVAHQSKQRNFNQPSNRKETLPEWAEQEPVKETPMSDQERAEIEELMRKATGG